MAFTTQSLLGWLMIMSCGLIRKSENGLTCFLSFFGGEGGMVVVNYSRFIQIISGMPCPHLAKNLGRYCSTKIHTCSMWRWFNARDFMREFLCIFLSWKLRKSDWIVLGWLFFNRQWWIVYSNLLDLTLLRTNISFRQGCFWRWCSFWLYRFGGTC